MIRNVVLSVVLAATLGACQSANSEDTSGVKSSAEGPFIESDSSGLVIDALWEDQTGDGVPPLDRPLPDGGPIAVLLGESTPTSLWIAVNGSSCVPETRLTIMGSPMEFRVALSLSEPMREDQIQCADVLTTHAFVLSLSQPVDLNGVVLVRKE